MISDVNYINLDVLNSYKNMIADEWEKFEKLSYRDFKSSRLNDSDNPYIGIKKQELNDIYEDILKSYDLIINWFSDYISNAKELELYLSSDYGITRVENDIIRNFLDRNFNK